MKNAVHFGAGNIGRGFIGLLLNHSDYFVNFVDVNDALIDALKNRNSYTVELIDDNSEKVVVNNVSGINSKYELDLLKKTLVEADLITTAVGVTILPIIAKSLVSAIEQRANDKVESYLNIIACENTIEGSTKLKNALLPLLSEYAVEYVEKWVGFPDSAVDRIVPNQKNEDILWVKVEPFYEWVIDQTKIKGELNIEGVHFTDTLEAYIERKLFTVNTGHTTAAYAGFIKGYPTIKDAMQDSSIVSLVEKVLSETGAMLVLKHGFDDTKQKEYIVKTIKRFKNPSIIDEVTRVGRSPLRKLAKGDRFIKPILECDTLGLSYEGLIQSVLNALKFDCAEDEESVKLQSMLKEKGLETTLIEVTGLEKEHKVIQNIIKQA
ncbi:MAG TPA: mannitol-1-phosphate 5-dehydrogenase [Erysipelotrichaceae bacterium]|nr:mannitol-1-phosphate 5-dehydrogenase [Erysipelotrichaceae bacterium]